MTAELTASSPIPDPEVFTQASSVEVYDEQGQKHTFGSLITGKKTAVIFIRHFWCGNCQAYVNKLGRSVPPSNLPSDTSIIIIGCGAHNPILTYKSLTASPYPIYADPSVELYKLFQFGSKMAGSKKGEEKGYEKDLGGSWTRIWTSLRVGPMRHIEHVNTVGPKSQNGGEIVFEQDGSCSFFHRMEHTADHAELPDLAHAIGAEYVPLEKTEGEATSCENGVKV